MAMEHTHDEYCEMILTPGTCNSQAGTVAGEYALRALRYPARRHPDENVFWWLEQGHRKAEKCNTATRISADHSRTVRKPANEHIIIASVEREPWRSLRSIT